MKQVLEYVVQGNTTQMDDPAFVAELKAWLRFNGRDSARTRDGLYSASSGSPSIQSWLGDLAFGLQGQAATLLALSTKRLNRGHVPDRATCELLGLRSFGFTRESTLS